MRYRIKRIESRRVARERAVLVFCLFVFFLCLALSEFYSGGNLPEFLFEIHKKLPFRP